MSNGIVMNGPIPIMFDMFSAVACRRPKRRSRAGAVAWSLMASSSSGGPRAAAAGR